MKKFNHPLTRIVIMSASGCLLILMAGRYTPVQTPIPPAAGHSPGAISVYGESLVDRVTERLEAFSDRAAAVRQEAGKQEYEPSVLKYNLVNLFPEESAAEEQEAEGIEAITRFLEPLYQKFNLPAKMNVKKSYGGQMYELLNKKDAEWTSGLYQWIQATPATAAQRLGRSSAVALGRYNPVNPLHKPEDPASWLVPSWKNISVNFYDGDGNRTDLYSNSQEIASMASVNTYYTGWQDVEHFKAYAEALWNASHSYGVSISDVYYCDGCVDPNAAAENADGAGTGTEAPSDASAQPSQAPEASGVKSPAEDTARQAEAALAGPASDSDIGSSAETADASAESFAAVPETAAGETAAVSETAAAGTKAADSTGAGSAASETAKASEAAASETEVSLTDPQTALNPQNSQNPQNSPASDETEATGGSAADNTTVQTPEIQLNAEGKFCPGHMDLTITAHIVGLSEKKNLFTIDKQSEKNGAKPWTPYMKSYVESLFSQDWEEEYGLSAMDLALGKPLTSVEINNYLSALPESTSLKRRTVIAYALNSVGKIPYYYGGKPYVSGYENNHFSTLTSPDQKGRVLRGLDCSGWINWVYWSSIGERLSALGTSGLIYAGRPISRDELKPGDIIVKPGLNSHVVMFMNWASNGSMICIHETGSQINNVTVSTLDAHWPYYRAILD